MLAHYNEQALAPNPTFGQLLDDGSFPVRRAMTNTRTGDRVIRGDAGILSPSIAGPTPRLEILQSLWYRPWAFYLTAMQEQTVVQIVRDEGHRSPWHYDPRTDLGDIDPSPPTAEEREAMRADVAAYLDGTLRMPPYAHR